MRQRAACAILMASLAACSTGSAKVFVPRSDYGLAPDARAYAEPGDCRGGAQLAAVDIPEPDYPRRAFRQGQQGWVVLRLDIDAEGRAHNVRVVDAQPAGPFEGRARQNVREWRFEPPGSGPLTNCIVVLDYRLGRASIGR